MMRSRVFGWYGCMLGVAVLFACSVGSAGAAVDGALAFSEAGGSSPQGVAVEVAPYSTEDWLADLVARAERENLHLLIESYPEEGLTVVHVAHGSKGEPEGVALGFSYCKLGTGYDGSHNITGEKYCFGPGESVHLGGHYEMLYDGVWCGDGWYRPDGSEYYENKNHTWIPDPSDYGYEWWNWYNVVFSYDPMPSSMQSTEGAWTAKWWSDGSNVCTKSYSVMYNLVDNTTSKGMSGDDEPLNRTSSFLVTDQYVYSWIRCNDYSLNFSDDFRWVWYGPEGQVAETIHDADNPGGTCWGWTKAWARLYVDGYYPAEHPGNWHVDIYIKDYNNNWKHKLTHNFTISCVSSGPSITQQPTPPSATICSGQSQTWCVSATGIGSLSYQWQRNTGDGWQNIGGATSSCHNATIAGSYRCVVSDACGSTNSSTAFLNVNTAPSITGQPDPPAVELCDGGSQVWCVQASGSGPLSYQWQHNSGGGWQNLSGETGTCVEVSANGSYRCQVTNDCGTVGSNSASLTILYAPTITTQPEPSEATICNGGAQQWCVAADGAQPVSYQWEQNTGGGWTLIAGATDACYDATAAATYRCGVSNTCGGPMYSDTVELTVDASPLVADIADHSTPYDEPYAQAPTLLDGTQPVTWTLVEGPDGMGIDELTGEVSWAMPSPPDSVHTVTIEATNVCGADQETWQLTVEPLPTFTIGGQVFTDIDNPLFSGLADVTVTVDGDGGQFVTSTLSSPVPGLWEITAVPLGEYTVDVEFGGFCFWHFVDGSPIAHPPVAITVDTEHQAPNQSILFWAVEDTPPDFDCDADVDMDDYAFIARCVAGPGVTTPPAGVTPDEFAEADLDNDGDVDLADAHLFLDAFIGN
jgi:hypothetical protein